MIHTDIKLASQTMPFEPDLCGAERAWKNLQAGYGGANASDGWMQLPTNQQQLLPELLEAADEIREKADTLFVLGIGGSYLGARAGLEMLRSSNYNLLPKDTPNVYFAGVGTSGIQMQDMLRLSENGDFCINVISKSGGTFETALSFRFFKDLLEKRYGRQEAAKRIYVTTGSQGALHSYAQREGCRTFRIPERVGGRYSVLSPVGLLPLAAAGIDVAGILRGAAEEQSGAPIHALQYAAARQALYAAGKKVELLVGCEPHFHSMGEWWKQLFGESEGKNGRGIFPAYAEFTTDLHSIGQYIQQGERLLMETLITFDEPTSALCVPAMKESLDALEGIAGMPLDTITNKAQEAAKLAHAAGGVPVIELKVPDISERSFGALVYFFEVSCAVSAMMLGQNPFDQPGVEAYKKNLRAMLHL